MKPISNIALITSGVITFLLAIGMIAFMLYLIIFENPNTDISNVFAISTIILSTIIALYVKYTNFGVQKSELQKTIEEKEKLKELVEISELKKKLSNLE